MIVGSEHIREVLADVCGHVERVHEVPPGVDVELWRPQPRARGAGRARSRRRGTIRPTRATRTSGSRTRATPTGSRAFLAGDRSTVVYFGKLIENKGVQLLFEALRGVDARAVIVGFGDYRAELEQQAEGLPVLFTGPLEHRHLVHLLALADVAVVPSIFPEAFGMVAAESAAAGCPPIVANHSGLAEIAQGLERTTRRSCGTCRASRAATRPSSRERLNEIARAGGRATRARSAQPRGKPRSSAGAGRAWPHRILDACGE